MDSTRHGVAGFIQGLCRHRYGYKVSDYVVGVKAEQYGVVY
jgi:hypothetical protein